MAMREIRTITRQLRPLGCALLLSCFALGGVQVLQAADQDGRVTIREDSPASYTVVRGDTLWDIAGRFLDEPWMWPQVWQVNPQIENPDLIYPGDVIELAYENGSPILRLARGAAADLPTVRLSPQVRREPILSPIPAIALDQISSFLSSDSILDAVSYDLAPAVLADDESRVLMSKGDQIFARGLWSSGVSRYDIVRAGRNFVDPDTGVAIGLEARAIGTATLESINGDRGILRIDNNKLEIKKGDRLVPSQNIQLEARYLPQPPPFQVNGAIVSMSSGKVLGGLHDTLVLNLGRSAGIEAGQILSVREPDQIIIDDVNSKENQQIIADVIGQERNNKLEFPGNRVGTVLVYRVFDNASLALVIRSTNVIRMNDRVVTP